MATTSLLLGAPGLHGVACCRRPNTRKENLSSSFKLASSSAGTSRGTLPQITHWSSTLGAPVIVKKREEEEEWMGHLSPEKMEVLAHLEPWAEAHMLPLLKTPEEAWQPSDLLPDPAALGDEGFHDACRELRARAAGLPDEALIVLVGNMITEEALPTYQSVPNRWEGVRDLTGADGTAWARWLRGWSAEENRHGDALNRYLYLSGRVDMRQIERTIHHLISNGMANKAARSPYHGFVYVAFQERATAISHGNTARLVGAHGDNLLARICGTIMSDEKRHEAAYTRVVGKLFEVDPDGAVRAFEYMMRQRIAMPAALMYDGRDPDLYANSGAVVVQNGVYGDAVYRSVLEHLIRVWRVEDLDDAVLSDKGRRARDYLCGLPHKMRRLEEKAHDRAAKAQKKPKSIPFSWIFDRTVNVVMP